MKSSRRQAAGPRSPVVRPLMLWYVLSLLTALLMAVASAAGLLYPARVYPSEELLQAFMANDAVNLAIGLPILLVSMWLARRGRLIGLLFWPGALMFVAYNYVAYAFGAPASWMFLLYLILVSLSVYTLIGLVTSMDAKVVQQRLTGTVPERLCGGILVVFAVFVVLRGAGVIATAALNGTAVPASDLPVIVSDFLFSPAWAIGGVLLWQRKPLGYVAGAGLLFQASMLFIGLIAFFLLTPALTGAPFAATDTIVVSAMGLVCFVPFALYVRGVLSRSK